jgi:hypothetical protein
VSFIGERRNRVTWRVAMERKETGSCGMLQWWGERAGNDVVSCNEEDRDGQGRLVAMGWVGMA